MRFIPFVVTLVFLWIMVAAYILAGRDWFGDDPDWLNDWLDGAGFDRNAREYPASVRIRLLSASIRHALEHFFYGVVAGLIVALAIWVAVATVATRG